MYTRCGVEVGVTFVWDDTHPTTKQEFGGQETGQGQVEVCCSLMRRAVVGCHVTQAAPVQYFSELPPKLQYASGWNTPKFLTQAPHASPAKVYPERGPLVQWAEEEDVETIVAAHYPPIEGGLTPRSSRI